MLVIKLSCKPKFLGNPFSDSEDSDTEMHVTMRYAYFKPGFLIRNILPDESGSFGYGSTWNALDSIC